MKLGGYFSGVCSCVLSYDLQLSAFGFVRDGLGELLI